MLGVNVFLEKRCLEDSDKPSRRLQPDGCRAGMVASRGFKVYVLTDFDRFISQAKAVFNEKSPDERPGAVSKVCVTRRVTGILQQEFQKARPRHVHSSVRKPALNQSARTVSDGLRDQHAIHGLR